MTLDWVTPADTGGSPITGYDYRVNDNAWEAIATSDATTVQHTVTGLDADTDYTFHVRAKNVIGVGAAASSGEGGTGPTTPTLTGDMGQIIEFKLGRRRRRQDDCGRQAASCPRRLAERGAVRDRAVDA